MAIPATNTVHAAQRVGPIALVFLNLGITAVRRTITVPASGNAARMARPFAKEVKVGAASTRSYARIPAMTASARPAAATRKNAAIMERVFLNVTKMVNAITENYQKTRI